MARVSAESRQLQAARARIAELGREIAEMESEAGVLTEDEFDDLYRSLVELGLSVRGQSAWTPLERLAEVEMVLRRSVSDRIRL